MYADELLQGTCQRVNVMRLAPKRHANVYHWFGGFYHTVLFVSDDPFLTPFTSQTEFGTSGTSVNKKR
jgi:hypothetical protein